MNKIDMKPVKSKKAYFQIIETFIHLIMDNQLEYGDRLYNEAELMEILNVSRPTLREALRVMEFLGIVNVSPRKGIVISDPKNNNYYLPLTYILAFEKTSNTDLFELRMSIELEMVGLAASRATEQDFAELKRVSDELVNLPRGDIKNFTRLDQLFHITILNCAKNELCSKLMNTLNTLIYDQLEQIHRALTNNDRNNTIEKHRAIYEALISRNEQMARKAMRDHLEHAYGVTKQLPSIFYNTFESK
ncbi:transcriptional regulator [Clostridium tetanomorphum DSM 665]|uniref:FadR family transcriptional regulator n=2 Tax=Clostridium tetanomorphum TaxID=1553 RepID=A0A923E9T2_CLOTT|nr:FadR/GntR family transcriptional regulator [Clostridium tetanomorphum]KAJ49028.1 transcriptional regulator [Clostridium tetanomorphum DSM 665]KAJ51720.1 transcriptional regulator [Clostridium tetanomorphum DSM 665]MBC2399105.1 FadR family transcriptional regulator [Clostridium tetanomorphum]MBP1865914.1 DNA-binding FadR family transcriptional regulator [Clostridium tetanomorphum]NRZ95883.1 DNA-binding FadR family transcriptional regulator [Clostridium tetanomorphum]